MKNLLFIACLLLVFHAHGQTWDTLGNTGFSGCEAQYTSIAIDSKGTVYAAYLDYNNGNSTTVMKYVSGNWVTVGSADFTQGELLGLGGGSYNLICIGIGANDTPYVAYADGYDSNKVTVMKFNSYYWEIVGEEGFSGYVPYYISLAFSRSGTPYVAYSAYGNEKTSLEQFNGSDWVLVGDFPYSPEVERGYNWLAIDNSGTPYVAYEDAANGSKASVMKYNDTGWASVGTPGFSPGSVSSVSIAIDNSGTPYLVYRDGAADNYASVVKYNGSGWVNVGSAGFSAGAANYTAIAINASGAPYVVYEDGGNGDKATAMMYNGAAWVPLGNAGFTDSTVLATNIAIDNSGAVYVLYEDGGKHDYTTVMRYGGPAGVKNVNAVASSLTAFPNPNHGSFTLNITTSPGLSKGEECNIIITNILGEKVKELTINTNTDTQIEMDSPAGIYFVTAVVGDGVVSGKVEVW